MSEIVQGPRIVVGVDGSAGSVLALRWALWLARSAHASIDAVGAWEMPTEIGWQPLSSEYAPKAGLAKAVNAAVDEVFGADRPGYVRVLIRDGHPVRVLVDESADARMLVVGSRGHGGFAGLLLGSVSARVAERAHCPVLVVHGEAVLAS
jgi:nucleotide-binding universal stress UspA family protein